MHPRIAEIPEPATAALDRNSVKVELVTGFCEAFRHFGHQFELEPDARNQASFPDGIRRRSKPAGKRFTVHIPVPDFQDAVFWPLRPAGINHQIPDPGAAQAVGDGHKVLMGRSSPICAPLVENDGQIVLNLRHVSSVGRLQAGGRLIEVTAHHGEKCRRRFERLPRRDGLRPVAELTVRQATREIHAIIPAVNLHLPRASPRDLGRPGDPGLGVLDGGNGEKPAHRKRADLSKALACDRASNP